MAKKYKFKGAGLTSTEKKRAKRQFDKYCKNYNYEKLNDLELLESLVFHEMLMGRIKKKIESLSKSKSVKDAEVVPRNLLDRLNEMEDQTLKIRDKLGLFEDRKTESPLKHLNNLKKKFNHWMEKNQASREIVCPFCSKLYFLKIRTDKYKAYKTPFFEDKILANKPLWEVYKKGKITKKEHSTILGVPTDYIDWLEEKIFKNTSN